MPSVDNIEQVYDVESPLEEAVKAILDALGFNTYTRTNAPDLSKEIERVEVIAKLGAATGHLRTLPMIAGGLTVRPDQCFNPRPVIAHGATAGLATVCTAGTCYPFSAKGASAICFQGPICQRARSKVH